MKYGFIAEKEVEFLNGLIATIKSEFGFIRFLEIGVFGGGTVTGIYNRAKEIGCPAHCEGVDFTEWEPRPHPAPDYAFHTGDSMDTWRHISGEFNLLFVDGCHCVNHCMADFLNYSPFVVLNGYCLFHDTALPKDGVVQGPWPQDHSYAGKPPSQLGVREGLKKLGLLQGHRMDWKLIHEIPSNTGLMGMILFKKVLHL